MLMYLFRPMQKLCRPTNDRTNGDTLVMGKTSGFAGCSRVWRWRTAAVGCDIMQQWGAVVACGSVLQGTWTTVAADCNGSVRQRTVCGRSPFEMTSNGTLFDIGYLTLLFHLNALGTGRGNKNSERSCSISCLCKGCTVYVARQIRIC